MSVKNRWKKSLETKLSNKNMNKLISKHCGLVWLSDLQPALNAGRLLQTEKSIQSTDWHLGVNPHELAGWDLGLFFLAFLLYFWDRPFLPQWLGKVQLIP